MYIHVSDFEFILMNHSHFSLFLSATTDGTDTYNAKASKEARKGMSAGAVAGLIMSILIGGAILCAAVIIITRKYCKKTPDYEEVHMNEL